MLGPLDPADDVTYGRLQRTYAAATRGLDGVIGRILKCVHEQDPDHQISIVFTADHGLPLGEHGVVGLGQSCLYEELVHTPLILRLPGDTEAGLRISALTQPVDFLPTLAELYGAQSLDVQGKSVLPLIRNEVEEIRAYACSAANTDGSSEWALRTPQWTYLVSTTKADQHAARMFVRPDDRWEVNNIIQHHPVLAEHLDLVLHEFVQAAANDGPVQPPPLHDVEALLQEQQQTEASSS